MTGADDDPLDASCFPVCKVEIIGLPTHMEKLAVFILISVLNSELGTL